MTNLFANASNFCIKSHVHIDNVSPKSNFLILYSYFWFSVIMLVLSGERPLDLYLRLSRQYTVCYPNDKFNGYLLWFFLLSLIIVLIISICHWSKCIIVLLCSILQNPDQSFIAQVVSHVCQTALQQYVPDVLLGCLSSVQTDQDDLVCLSHSIWGTYIFVIHGLHLCQSIDLKLNNSQIW